MAAVTHAGTTWNTTAGNKTVAATPAVGDLIVVIAATSGIAGGTTNVSDNNSDGLGSYTQVDSDRTGFSTTGVLTVWVRNGLIGSASSTTFTATQASSTGGGLTVFRVSGMTRTGPLAVRGTGGQSSGTAATTPAPVLSLTPLTGNPVIGAVANGTSPATLIPRSSPAYSEASDLGYATPTTGLESMSVDSGETSATITWGGTSATAFASVAVELDTSSIPGPTITSFETADWTSTGATKTITVPGAVTGDKIVVLYGGDNASSGNVSAATASTTGGSTSSWTEPEEGLAAVNQAWASSSAADVTADGTVTVTLSRTQSTGQPWGGWAALVHNHNGVGVHARSAPSATETVTLAGITQDSAVLILGIDWDDLTNVAFSPAGAIDVERSAGTNVAWYAGYWMAQAAGTRNYGIATSSTTNLHIIAIEMLAASGVLTLSPTGIASAEAFGTAAASLTLTANPTGISSAEAFGTASATFQTSTAPTGIASAEAFGTPTATPTLTASPTGIASAQAFGTAVASTSLTTSPTGIASAESFGTATASPVTATAPTGIPTAELFGAVAVALSLLLGPTGVPSAEAFGTGTATATLTVSPSGIASAQAFGAVTATLGQLTVSPSGVASAEAWGTAAATLSTLTASPTGIPSAEAFGSAAVTVSGTSAPVGIPSSEAFGVPVVALSLSVAPTGIGSLAAFGVPVAALSLTASPTGIASGQAFGVPVASPVLTANPTGIPSAQAVGVPSAALSLVVAPVGIPSAETFGTVVITGGSVTPVRDLALTGSIQAARFSGTIARGRYAGSLKPGRMTGDLQW